MRIFSAGTSSSNDYYLTGNRLNSTNPLVGYEQGYNIGLNMQALVNHHTITENTFHLCTCRVLYIL